MSEKVFRGLRAVLRLAVVAVALVVVVIGLAVLLQLLDANPEAGFTDWAYGNQDAVMTPFEDVFDPVELGEEGNVVDVSGLFAMAVYACLFIPLGLGLGWVRRRLERLEVRREEQAALARQSRILGEEPATPASTARRGVRARLRGRGTDGGSREGEPAEPG